AWHEPAIRVRRRRAKGEQRGRVRKQAADVRAGKLRQPGIPGLVRHQRRAVLPEGLVAVHAGAVVAEDRLRHEGDGLAGGARDVLDHVLVGHDLIGHARQGLEAASAARPQSGTVEEARGNREVPPQVPGSLGEALDALEADHAFLTKGGVFSEELIRTWIDYKRENEVDVVRLRPHPAEFSLYFDA